MTDRTVARIEYGLGTFKQAMGIIGAFNAVENIALAFATRDFGSHLAAATVLAASSGYLLWTGDRAIVRAEGVLNQRRRLQS